MCFLFKHLNGCTTPHVNHGEAKKKSAHLFMTHCMQKVIWTNELMNHSFCTQSVKINRSKKMTSLKENTFEWLYNIRASHSRGEQKKKVFISSYDFLHAVCDEQMNEKSVHMFTTHCNSTYKKNWCVVLVLFLNVFFY